jgi:subtilase family serine protease
VVVALAALAATTTTALARTKLVGPAPSQARIQLVLPLVANDAGLKAFAYAVSTPGSKLYAHYESIPELARRFGAPRQATERVVRYLRSIGATAVRPDGTGMSVDATVSVAVAERAFGMPLGSFSTNTQRFIAPVGAGASAASSNVPAALDHLVTGVIGLDTQSIVSGQDQVATRHTRKRVPSTFAHASQAQPSSAYGPASGTRAGCAGGKAIGGFTPNQ